MRRREFETTTAAAGLAALRATAPAQGRPKDVPAVANGFGPDVRSYDRRCANARCGRGIELDGAASPQIGTTAWPQPTASVRVLDLQPDDRQL